MTTKRATCCRRNGRTVETSSMAQSPFRLSHAVQRDLSFHTIRGRLHPLDLRTVLIGPDESLVGVAAGPHPFEVRALDAAHHLRADLAVDGGDRIARYRVTRLH